MCRYQHAYQKVLYVTHRTAPVDPTLPRSEKLRLIQVLAADAAGEEALKINLPPCAGSVQGNSSKLEDAARYPLWGTPVDYRDPTEPVAESDWQSLK